MQLDTLLDRTGAESLSNYPSVPQSKRNGVQSRSVALANTCALATTGRNTKAHCAVSSTAIISAVR
jgi:hypothetical protein